MRVLSILIKRQIVDGVGYFVVAIFASAVLIVAITSVALTEELWYQSLYTIILLITVPIFVCIGSYALGLSQAHNDRTTGITTLLSVMPLTHGQVLLAQVITAVLVILTALGPLAIVGAILWEFLGPPEWFFRDWVSDVFVGMSLTAFGCYCLGLYTGQITETFTSGLRALSLTPILLLLIIVKGFGWPLIIVLLPFVVVSLLRCRRSSGSWSMATVATGFIVLVLLAILLYLGRYFSEMSLMAKMSDGIKVSPSGLLPPDIENDPNAFEHSYASAGVSRMPDYNSIVGHILRPIRASDRLFKHLEASHLLLEHMGIIEYFQSRARGKDYSCHAHSFYLVHLDEMNGQLVYRRGDPDKGEYHFTWAWKETTRLYAGPKGVSRTPHSKIGRFGSPIVVFEPPYLSYWPARCIVYDRNSRGFFAIDFENQTIRRGPELKDSTIRPLEIGSSSDFFTFRSRFDFWSKRYRSLSSGYLPIVDESGRIDLIDPNTLELSGPAGYLPRPRTLFGWGSRKPKDLLAYDVDIVAIGPYRTKGEHLGMVVGSLSRQGMWMTLAVFDKEGNRVRTTHAKTTFFEVPWGPELVMTKYLFESLHPPVLTLASFLTAYSFKADSTHRALFFMPNSFVALLRDRQGSIFSTFSIALLIMLPALLFAGFLGWLVVRDAAVIGLSPNSRRIWLLGTLAFGLVGYITYRLTRPRITLVTCQNCGKLRRPDMNKCHRCGSDWHVPELTPPAWRVLG